MAAPSLIYTTSANRTRLKALAHIDGRTMAEYFSRLLERQVAAIPPAEYREAIEIVTDGNPENAE